MKRLLLTLLLLVSIGSLRAQEILVGVDFQTYFDNKEFGANTFAEHGVDLTGTDFAASITPNISLRWAERNTLYIGADMTKYFGANPEIFLDDIIPVFYYKFESPKVKAVTGIFFRDEMHDADFSTAFISETERYNHSTFGGLMAQYNGKRNSYVEMAIDWEGLYSPHSREQFRIWLGGRHYLNVFYYGFNFTLTHFAGQEGVPEAKVVDYLLLNPCVGAKFNAFFDFDFKLGVLLSAQRDRGYSSGWEMPHMGEAALKISRWGLSLEERFYFGENLHPFFYGHTLEDGTPLPYGQTLYPGESFFRTTEGFYSRTAIAYTRSFFNDTLSVRAEFSAHHDGTGLGTQQILSVNVNLLKSVYNSKNHKK